MNVQNEQAFKMEKKFLAYLFSEKRYIAMTLGKVTKDHLVNTYPIYSLVLGYYNKFKGIITDDIVDSMFKKKNLNSDTIVAYKSLISEVKCIPLSGDSEFEAIMAEIDEQFKRRQYIKVAEKIVNINPLDCPTDRLEKMEEEVKSKIVELTTVNTDVRKEGAIKDSIEERIERYNTVKHNPEVVRTIPSGFRRIDDGEGGFRPGELIYVIGRKGDGKSVLMLNLAHNAWAAGCNVILFSLEISKEDYERRFDSRAAGVSSNGLKRGTLSEAEEKIYMDYLKNQAKGLGPEGNQTGTFYVVDLPSGCTPAFVDSKVDTIEQLTGIKFDMIITDYAGIMKPNVAADAKRHEQGAIALDLKRIARSRECVVISAAQMTREGGKSDKSDTGHVAESDQISDHIDWGISIRSISETTGRMQSFKTRDAAPFDFHFTKRYSCMKIEELKDDLDSWENLTPPL